MQHTKGIQLQKQNDRNNLEIAEMISSNQNNIVEIANSHI